MAVVAITRIVFGADDGSVNTYEIGDTLDLDENRLRDLVQGGSAVEIGKDKRFSSPLNSAVDADEATRKRDEIIAKAQAGEDPTSPPSPAASIPPTVEEATRLLREKEEEERKANESAKAASDKPAANTVGAKAEAGARVNK